MLNKLEIRKYFAAVLGPESCTEKKPHPAPVLKALRILKADPATAVMIGDHHTDLKAGKGAGIRTCFCAWGIGEDGGFPCDYFAGSPADLMKIFPLQ
jgi:phosphoglycolate phosphatase